MLWEIGVIYSVMLLTSPMTVTYLTYKVGKASVSIGKRITCMTGNVVNGFYRTTCVDKDNDDWVCINHPMYMDTTSPKIKSSHTYIRKRRYSI